MSTSTMFNNVLLCSRPEQKTKTSISTPIRPSSASKISNKSQTNSSNKNERSSSVGNFKMKTPFKSMVREFEYACRNDGTKSLRMNVENGIKERSRSNSTIIRRNKESVQELSDQLKYQRLAEEQEHQKQQEKEKKFEEKMKEMRTAILTNNSEDNIIPYVPCTTSALKSPFNKNSTYQKMSKNTNKPIWAYTKAEINGLSNKINNNDNNGIVNSESCDNIEKFELKSDLKSQYINDKKLEDEGDLNELLDFAKSLPDIETKDTKQKTETFIKPSTMCSPKISEFSAVTTYFDSENIIQNDIISEAEIDNFIQSLFADKDYMANVHSIFSELENNYETKNPYKNYGAGIPLTPTEIKEQHRKAIRRELITYYSKLKYGKNNDKKKLYENDLGGIDIDWKKESPDDIYGKLVKGYINIYEKKKEVLKVNDSNSLISPNEILLAGTKGNIAGSSTKNIENFNTNKMTEIDNELAKQVIFDDKTYVRLKDLLDTRLSVSDSIKRRREEDIAKAPQSLPFLYRTTN